MINRALPNLAGIAGIEPSALTCNIRSSCAFAGPAHNATINNVVPMLLIRDPSRQKTVRYRTEQPKFI
jgi:hypothetical protein